jgi:Lower baseplate protein N-terminal domain
MEVISEMATIVRVKRRSSGAPGAPANLFPAEVAYNEVDDTLYYGKGSGGAGGTATSIEAIGGKGAVVTKTGDQNIAGIKTFSSSPVFPTPATNDNSANAATTAFVKAVTVALGAGDMLKSIYDTNNNGVVDNAERLGGTLAAAFAVLASPIFTGTPTAPTPATNDNTTTIATTAFVRAFLTSLMGAASGIATLDAQSKVPAAQLPAYVDDVLEFANQAAFPPVGETGKIYVALDTNRTYRWSGSAYVAIASGDVNTVFGRSGNIVATAGDYSSTLVTNASSVSGATVTAALNALLAAITGLGTMSAQNANAVAITGGTIDGVTIDGGTF